MFSANKKASRLTCFFLEAPPRIELGMTILQTAALPLGYGAEKMERETGLEPATSALARRRSTK